MGKSSSGTTFTWNALSYDGKYIDWLKGFSGVKILNNATVQGQVRKPTTPAGVGQANWKVIVKGVTYTCNTTTNITTTYNQLVKDAAAPPATPITTPTPTPATPATPAPTTSTPTPAPVTATGTFSCNIGTVLKDTAGLEWYPVTIVNKTGTATKTLADINFTGKAPNSTFTWNGSTNSTYFKWISGFSGAAINNNATVLGQIRKPVTPAGVDQGDWTLVIAGKSYPCSSSAPQVTTLPVPKVATLTCEADLPQAVSPENKQGFGSRIINNTDVASDANKYEIILTEKIDNGTPKIVQTKEVPVVGAKNNVFVYGDINTYAKKDKSKLLLVVSLRSKDGKTNVPCSKFGAVTYDLGKGTGAATPVATTPLPVPPKDAPKPKVADLGYGDNLNLQCISRKGTGKAAVFTAVPCAQANTLIVTVSGKDNSVIPRNKLSYGVDVSRNTTDHFGTVTGCAPREVVVNGKKVTYDCTIVYYNQSFFQSTAKSVSNFFKSILAKAKADTYLSKSEAKADIAKLRAGDLKTAQTKIVLSHAGYVSQIVNGENLVLDYNESSAVNQIVQIARTDCENKDGTFNTSTYTCTTSPTSNNQSSGSSTGSSSSGGSSASGAGTGISSSPSSCQSGYHWSNTSNGAPQCVKNTATSIDCDNSRGYHRRYSTTQDIYYCAGPITYLDAQGKSHLDTSADN